MIRMKGLNWLLNYIQKHFDLLNLNNYKIFQIAVYAMTMSISICDGLKEIWHPVSILGLLPN